MIDQQAGFLYGKTALYVAQDARARRPRARTSRPPTCSSPTRPTAPSRPRPRPTRSPPSTPRRCPFEQAGRVLRAWRSRSSTASRSPRPASSRSSPRRGRDPRGRRPGAQGRRPTRSRPPAATSRRSTRAARRATCTATSPTTVGKKPVALLFATPQLCQSRVCGPVVDVGLQLRAQYGDQVDFIHQEVYTDNDPQQGPAQAAAGVQPADGAVAVRRRQGRPDHRAARGLVRARRVRAGAEDRAVSRRARLAVLAGAGGGRDPRRRRRAGARARPAHEPADPGVAVRLGGGDRARRVVRRARGAVAAAAAAGAGLAAAARARAACSAAGPSRCCAALIGVALLVVILGAGYAGQGLGARQPRPDVHPDRLLGRARVRERAVRRPVPRVQPVARDPAARASGPIPEPWGRYPAALALLGFTWIELVSGWGDTPVTLTHAAVGYTVYTLVMQAVFGTEAWTPQRRGLRRLLQPLLADLDLGDARPRGRRAPAARRPAAARRRRRDGALRHRDDRHGHVRRLQPGPALEGPVGRRGRRDRRDRRARRGAEGGRDGRAARSRSR